MNNPWPESNGVPQGANPDAISHVRMAYDYSPFYMAQILGITRKELNYCETEGRWPQSADAKHRLITMANARNIYIGQEEEAQHQDVLGES